MVKLLSTISLVLVLILFPPAALALISNNAIPGDTTYPVKRGLESVIYTVASISPASKAWFSAARSDRRFKEFKTLIAQGKSTHATIDELVSQTEIAAQQIDQITDPVEKEKYISELMQSIQKYDQGLAQVSQKSPLVGDDKKTASANVVAPVAPKDIPRDTKVAVPVPTPTSTSTPTPTPTPIKSGLGPVDSTPKATPDAKVVSTPVPVITAPQPTPIPTPRPTPQPTPSSPASGAGGDDQAAEDARKKLKDIEDQLKKNQSKHDQDDKKAKEEDGDHGDKGKGGKKKD